MALGGLLALGAVASRSGRVRQLASRSLAAARDGAGELTLGLAAEATRAEVPLQLDQVLYDAGLGEGWFDFGWCPRTLERGAPASLDLADTGGWIVARPGLAGAWEGLAFRLQPPPGEKDFLEVRVSAGEGDAFPTVRVGAAHRRPLPGGWQEVLLPMKELNPGHQRFDRVVFRAFRGLPHQRVLLDRIGLVRLDVARERAERAQVLGRPRAAALSVDCRATATPISPFIYGTNGHGDAAPPRQWALPFGARRWGGNPTSVYNWELHAWNTSFDWFFENVKVESDAAFLDQNRAHGLESFVTVPTLGWVAKDTTSSSFPRSRHPVQASFDGYRPEAGDGKRPDGTFLPSPPPTQAYQPAPPEYVARWVTSHRQRDAKAGGRSVREYILDNEPIIWDATHRDVHPEPVGYDELLDRTLRYAAAVRAADPGALIAGPALWGWPAYLYSGIDAKEKFRFKPDHRAHGSVYLLPWWLRQVRAHEQKTGVKLLDVLDVHFYPQAEGLGLGGGPERPETSALRLRSTRALWDPSYEDESWIKEPIQLIPRLKGWVAENAPGLKLQLGEWNFGGEQHPTGGLATAEALGRFGALGVYAAFYWTLPPEGSPSYQGFRAYLDYDGQGARFLDHALPAQAPEGASVFASRDASGTRAVLVVLNFSPTEALAPTFSLAGCAGVVGRRLYTWEPGAAGFVALPPGQLEAPVLAPYSITVVDLRFEGPMSGAIAAD